MKGETMNNDELAVAIHNEVCGCDDKFCTLTTEIRDWLEDGDASGLTLEQVIEDWIEYDSQE